MWLLGSDWLATPALEHSQAISHYPDQGDSEYAVDPGCGKYMNYRLQIYVRASWSFCQRALQDCEQILLGKI